MPTSSEPAVPPSWHVLELSRVTQHLRTDGERGLTSADAAARLQEFGPNRLPEARPTPLWRVFARQFASTVVFVLLAAAIVSALLGEWIDALAIGAILVLNAALGFVQEFRAEQSLAALRRLSVPHARVVRDGVPAVVAAADVVPGDLVEVEAGDRVPADARIAYAAALRASEASLTGESAPVSKRDDALGDAATPLADRSNMLFFGTEVAAGKARAIVVATGPRTELGRIATLIGTAGPESTPLEKRLERLGAALLVVSLAVVVVVFALGLLRGEPIVPMFLTAVSLAVAAIPEGLPAMVTITLALGVTRMARRNALVRRLSSVETLGSTTVICTDKTGTLTRGQMAVRALHAAGQPWVPVDAGSPAVRAMLETSVLCNDARVVDEDGTRRIIGDPTEAALLEAALASGVDPGELDARQPVVLEFPFDAERKRMTVLRRSGNGVGFVAHVKGAVDVILPRCTAMAGADGSDVSLDSVAILAANDAFAREALRVLAIARRPMAEVPPSPSDGDIERDLTMLGLVAMEDPLRPEAKPAVEACRSAGIRVVMITGDHRATASSIAAQLGLLAADGVMSGVDLDRATDAELAAAVSNTAVYARVTAEHKLRIIRAWKSQGAIVAMTGDGVNDAPALKQADVGIAMGITGTDVAKDASDIVVTDDNFASIVAAVEEGRSIYANIQRGLQYLLSCNLSEILLMLLASMLALPLPLLPVQILWTNLVTDGLPALALAVEPGDPDAMRRPPRAANARFLDRHRLVTIARHGFFMAAAPLLAYAWVLQQGAPIAQARGLAFSILVFSQLAHAFNSRHERTSIFTLGPLSNRALVLACVSAALMQLAILTFPPLRPIFNVAPLGPVEWGLALGLGGLPIAGMELEKWIARRRADRA